MSFITSDRVKETATTTGTGDFTLAGAVDTYRRFSAVCSTSDTFPYAIEGASGTGEWETGIGTYSAANTLTRATVIASSNSNNAVNFSAGTKNVMITGLGFLAQPTLIATQATTSGTSVAFTSIPRIYKTLNFEIAGMSHDSGSNQSFRVELSGDNGSTYTTAFAITGTGAASQTYYGSVQIPNYRKAAGMWTFALANLTSDTTEAAGAVSNGTHAWRIAAGINAVRFSPSGGNLDAGSINLWGL